VLRIDVGDDDACGVDLNVKKRASVRDDGEREEVGQVGLGPADQAGPN